MRTLFIIILVVFSLSNLSIAQTNNTNIKNDWAVGLMYSDNGFGLTGTHFKRLGRTTDLFFKLTISGVSDQSEIEYFDIYGNSFIKDKLNRIYLTTLSVGIKKNVFFDDIEGNFKPFIRGGVAPAFILTTPYEKGFFKAFGYAQSSFAAGGFVGFGMEYYESKSVGLSIGLDYYYLHVLGRDVYSIKDKKISNIGGLELSFNFMFLK